MSTLSQRPLRVLLGALLLAGLTGGTRAQGFPSPLFGPPKALSGTLAPTFEANSGDLDGDGRPELVARSQAGPFVRVFRSVNGLLDTVTNYPVPMFFLPGLGTPLADVDMDGQLDVITGDSAFGLQTLHGLGNGTLAPYIAAGGLPSGLQSYALGDVDDDGLSDLVCGTASIFGSGHVSVLRGLGDGTFASAHSVASVLSAAMTRLGDIDLDGQLDIAVQTGLDFGAVDQVLPLRGLGDGDFSAWSAVQFVWETSDRGLSLADMDRDGFPDLVVASSVPVAQLARGHGDGSFTLAPGLSTAPFEARRLITPDLDLDGFADIVTSALVSAQRVGPGLQPLGAPVGMGLENQWEMPVVDDFDADGVPDLVTWHGGPGVLQIGVLGPIIDVGYASPGGPVLSVSGTPAASAPVTLSLSGAGLGLPALLVVGAKPAHLSWGGLDLVPSTDVVFGLATGVPFATRWPDWLAPGTPLYLQAVLPTSPVALSEALVVVP